MAQKLKYVLAGGQRPRRSWRAQLGELELMGRTPSWPPSTRVARPKEAASGEGAELCPHAPPVRP